MTTDEILALIRPEDKSEIAQATRQDLQNGGPCLLGLDIHDGYVTTIISQSENASLAPFMVESDTYSMDNAYGPAHRLIKIRRNSAAPPEIDPFLTKPAWPEKLTHGGARPGAGRKPIKDEDRKRTVTISFRVKETTRNAIQDLREAGIDMNAELEKLVARLGKRDTKG